MNNTYSDADLIRSYLKGNSSSFDVLLEKHQQRLFAFIYSKVYDKDIADDIFQDTFIKAIQTLNLGNYNEEGKFLPWIMRIAHNLVIDHFRRNKRMPKYDNRDDFDIFSQVCEPSKDIESILIDDQIQADLRSMIDTLPAEQHEVLFMRIFKEMSFKEIAEATGVSINTALGRMRYAVINLRKLIKEKNIQLVQ